jgi:hypothetical protein
MPLKHSKPILLTFVAQHSYVEGTVTKPEHSELDGLSRKALLKLWREDERSHRIKFGGRSDDEMQFYIQNGCFPDEADSSPIQQETNDYAVGVCHEQVVREDIRGGQNLAGN